MQLQELPLTIASETSKTGGQAERGLLSAVHREGNYLLGLVSATGLLAPSSLPGPAGTLSPLSLARAAYRARASKTDKVKALLWPVMNWFVLHGGRASVRVGVCLEGEGGVTE